MKKFLILMLVLGLASTASAVPVTEFTLQSDGLVLQVVGVADVTVEAYYIFSGSTIDIAIPQGGGYPIRHTTVGNLGENDYTAGDLAAVDTAALMPPDIAQISVGTLGEGDTVDAGLWFTIDIDDVSTAGWTIGQVVDTLDMYDRFGGPLGTLDVTSTIPEPMTIALLGLGSLFLLRRRK